MADRSAAAAIGWIDAPDGGKWGPPEMLTIPLSDRGLSLADGLFETVLLEAGRPWLLAEHLQRWLSSAALLGMAPPPDRPRVEGLVREAVRRSGIATGALRLNWSRGSARRGIDLPVSDGGEEPAAPHRFWLQLSAGPPRFDPLGVIVSRSEQRNAASLLSRCKTFAYGPSVQARREARSAGADDALLASTAGGLCCGTTANLLVRRHDQWWTPALGSGCLPGVMRARALALGLAREAQAPLEPRQLEGGALLVSSLGCRPIQSLEGRPLPLWPDPEGFWRQLLDGGPEVAPELPERLS